MKLIFVPGRFFTSQSRGTSLPQQTEPEQCPTVTAATSSQRARSGRGSGCEHTKDVREPEQQR